MKRSELFDRNPGEKGDVHYCPAFKGQSPPWTRRRERKYGVP